MYFYTITKNKLYFKSKKLVPFKYVELKKKI